MAERPVFESGLKISKIDSLVYDENRQYSLSELIAWKTPVFIKSYGRGSMATASFRGTDPSHTQVTWNGIPVNSPLLGMADFSLLPLMVAGGLDLYHGTASLMSGYPSIGGRIAMTSRPAWNTGFELDVISAAGSYLTFDEAVKAGYSNRDISIGTGLWYSRSRNNFEFTNRDILNGGVQTRENAQWQRYGIVADVYRRLRGNGMLSLNVWAQHSERSIPQLSTNESGNLNNINRQNDDMLYALVAYSNYTEKSKLTMQTALAHQQNRYGLQNYISGSGFLNAVNSHSLSWSGYSFADYRVSFGSKCYVSGLLQIDYHNVLSEELVWQREYKVSRFESAATVSFFYKPLDKITMGIALRQQLSNLVILPAMPSLQFEYRLLPGIIYKANASRMVRIPSLNDLYFQPGGNPELLPEKSLMAETGIELAKTWKQIRLSGEMSGYYSTISNWIMWKPTHRGYWTPTNIERVQINGIEVSGKAEANVNNVLFSMQGAYTLAKSINKSPAVAENDMSYGSRLPYIPLHSATLYANLSYRAFFVGYQWNYYSERLTNIAGSNSPLLCLYPYFMNDLSMGKHFVFDNCAIHVRFAVMNLFNESYRSVLWQPMPGRNYMLTLRFLLK